MANKSPNADFFQLIGATLDSGDKAARTAAMRQLTAALITTAGHPLPAAPQLHRIIAGLSSILCASHSDIPTNRAVRRTLLALRSRLAAVDDDSRAAAALHAIHCCWEDEALGYVLRDAAGLRLLSMAAQRGALTVLRACLPRRRAAAAVAAALTSLLSSPHSVVVRGCAETLVTSPPGIACAVTKAYCSSLAKTPSLAPSQISDVVMVLDHMQKLSSVIMEYYYRVDDDDMAMVVIRALEFRDLTVRRKVLDLALSVITPWNVDSMVVFLRKEMNVDEGSDEYRGILEKAIYACHGKYIKA